MYTLRRYTYVEPHELRLSGPFPPVPTRRHPKPAHFALRIPEITDPGRWIRLYLVDPKMDPHFGVYILAHSCTYHECRNTLGQYVPASIQGIYL